MTPTAKSNSNGAPDLDRLVSARRVRELLVVSHPEVRRTIGDRADPDSLTPHERLRELTAILANGIHRLRAIPPALPECREILAESPPTGLDPGARTHPDGAVLTRNENGDQ